MAKRTIETIDASIPALRAKLAETKAGGDASAVRKAAKRVRRAQRRSRTLKAQQATAAERGKKKKDG